MVGIHSKCTIEHVFGSLGVICLQPQHTKIIEDVRLDIDVFDVHLMKEQGLHDFEGGLIISSLIKQDAEFKIIGNIILVYGICSFKRRSCGLTIALQLKYTPFEGIERRQAFVLFVFGELFDNFVEDRLCCRKIVSLDIGIDEFFGEVHILLMRSEDRSQCLGFRFGEIGVFGSCFSDLEKDLYFLFRILLIFGLNVKQIKNGFDVSFFLSNIH